MVAKAIIIKIMEYLQYREQVNFYWIFRLKKPCMPKLSLLDMELPSISELILKNPTINAFFLNESSSLICKNYPYLTIGLIYILERSGKLVDLYWICKKCNTPIKIKCTHSKITKKIRDIIKLNERIGHIGGGNVPLIVLDSEIEINNLLDLDNWDDTEKKEENHFHYDTGNLNSYGCLKCRKKILEETKYIKKKRDKLVNISKDYERDYQIDFIKEQLEITAGKNPIKITIESDNPGFGTEASIDKTSICYIYVKLARGPVFYSVNEDNKDYTYAFVRKEEKGLVDIVYVNPSPRVLALQVT
jgi:hypothetical protein